jgi:competence protein ComEA
MRPRLCLVVLASLWGSSPTWAKSKQPLVISGVINLNEATATQLDLLPGVGERAAERIIEHRTKGRFTRPQELVKVRGFGKKRYEALKPHLTVTGPTTLSVAPRTAQGRSGSVPRP